MNILARILILYVFFQLCCCGVFSTSHNNYLNYKSNVANTSSINLIDSNGIPHGLWIIYIDNDFIYHTCKLIRSNEKLPLILELNIKGMINYKIYNAKNLYLIEEGYLSPNYNYRNSVSAMFNIPETNNTVRSIEQSEADILRVFHDCIPDSIQRGYDLINGKLVSNKLIDYDKFIFNAVEYSYFPSSTKVNRKAIINGCCEIDTLYDFDMFGRIINVSFETDSTNISIQIEYKSSDYNPSNIKSQ